MRRVFIIQNIIPNYREPVFSGLSRSVDLTVFYSELSSKARKSNFVQKKVFESFKSNKLQSFSFRGRVYQFSILRQVILYRPEAIVAQNMGQFDMLALLILCKILSIEIFWWQGGTPYVKDRKLYAKKGFVKFLLGDLDPRWFLSKQATGMFVYTEHARNFFAQRGFRIKDIIVAPNSPDTNTLLKFKSFNSSNPEVLDSLKSEIGTNDRKVIFLLGRLDETRRVFDLIEAAKILNEKSDKFFLLIVGEGQYKEPCQHLCMNYGLKNIHFAGAVYDDRLLSRYFMISDFFVTPGVASMAIKMAMTFEVPVITANYGLEVHDVENGITGFVYDLGDYNKIVELIEFLANREDLRRDITKRALRKIEKTININRMVESFADRLK